MNARTNPEVGNVAGSAKPETRATSPHMLYRPDIDGLRAFAVMAVVIFHAFPEKLLGGYVGVDIFFVISGFLISSIIFQSLDKGNFSFVGFYARRIRRIFPALILVLASCLAFGWFFLLGSEYEPLGKHVMAGVGFVQNIVLYSESGYFDDAASLKPLLHLWSLGIEEQFYFVFPILAVVLWRVRALALGALLLLLAASFALSVHQVATVPSQAFFLPFGRAWELLIGSLLAYYTLYRKVSLTQWVSRALPNARNVEITVAVLRNGASVLGLLLLLASVTEIDKGKPFPGAWAVPPVLSTALIILSGPTSWVNRRLFSLRWVVWLGLISYPLYLWHWPVLVFLRIVNVSTPSTGAVVMAVVISLVLAFLTYFFIERPLRKGVPSTGKTIGLVGLSLLVGAFGALVYLNKGILMGMNDREEFAQFYDRSYNDRNDIASKYRADCDFYDLTNLRKGKETAPPLELISPSCYTPTSDVSVMLWGDSHAQHLYYGLKNTLPADISLLISVSSGCPAGLPADYAAMTEYCRLANEGAMTTIKNVRPKIVVIAQHHGLEEGDNILRITQMLKGEGVEHVLVIGPVPRYDPHHLSKIVLREYWHSSSPRISNHLVPEVKASDILLKRMYGDGQGGFDYRSAWDAFCNEDGCLAYLGDDRMKGLVSFDYGHFTAVASEYFANTVITPYVLSALGRSDSAAPLKEK